MTNDQRTMTVVLALLSFGVFGCASSSTTDAETRALRQRVAALEKALNESKKPAWEPVAESDPILMPMPEPESVRSVRGSVPPCPEGTRFEKASDPGSEPFKTPTTVEHCLKEDSQIPHGAFLVTVGSYAAKGVCVDGKLDGFFVAANSAEATMLLRFECAGPDLRAAVFGGTA